MSDCRWGWGWLGGGRNQTRGSALSSSLPSPNIPIAHPNILWVRMPTFIHVLCSELPCSECIYLEKIKPQCEVEDNPGTDLSIFACKFLLFYATATNPITNQSQKTTVSWLLIQWYEPQAWNSSTEIGEPGILRCIFSMDLADSGDFHRAVARLYHHKDNTLVRALNKALFLINLGGIGDLATYSTRNLLIDIVGHRLSACLCCAQVCSRQCYTFGLPLSASSLWPFRHTVILLFLSKGGLWSGGLGEDFLCKTHRVWPPPPSSKRSEGR